MMGNCGATGTQNCCASCEKPKEDGSKISQLGDEVTGRSPKRGSSYQENRWKAQPKHLRNTFNPPETFLDATPIDNGECWRCGYPLAILACRSQPRLYKKPGNPAIGAPAPDAALCLDQGGRRIGMALLPGQVPLS
jgi:hypothetical protein